MCFRVGSTTRGGFGKQWETLDLVTSGLGNTTGAGLGKQWETMDLAMLDDFCARGLQSPESTTTHKLSRVRNSSEWYHIAGEAMRCDACDIVETPMPLNARRIVRSLAVSFRG